MLFQTFFGFLILVQFGIADGCNYTCPDGWSLSQRSSTRAVCFRIANGFNLTYSESDTLCNSQLDGSYFSGMETGNEYDQVIGLIKSTVQFGDNSQVFVNFATQRRDSCIGTKVGIDEHCPVLKAYKWLDTSIRYAKIFQHFNFFADGQPDTEMNSTHRCLGILAYQNGSATDYGKFYSTDCNSGVQTTPTLTFVNSAVCAVNATCVA